MAILDRVAAVAACCVAVLYGASLAVPLSAEGWASVHEARDDAVHVARLLVGGGWLDGTRMSGNQADGRSLQGRAVVVTESSRGLGLQAARRFYALGANVIVSSRKLASAQKAANDTIATVMASGVGGSMTGEELDLANFTSVRLFSGHVLYMFHTVHILVLAGSTPGGAAEEGGAAASSEYNRIMSTNHLGHFLLASLLAPSMAVGSSIIVPSALSAWWGDAPGLLAPAGAIWRQTRGDDTAKLEDAEMYATSQLARLCFAQALQSRVAPRRATVVQFVLPERGTSPSGDGALDLEDSTALGDLLFEAAFVSSMRQLDDVIYPFWFPQRVVAADALPGPAWPEEMKAQVRRPGRLRRFSQQLHSSVGPKCSSRLQREVWRLSNKAVGLPSQLNAEGPWMKTVGQITGNDVPRSTKKEKQPQARGTGAERMPREGAIKEAVDALVPPPERNRVKSAMRSKEVQSMVDLSEKELKGLRVPADDEIGRICYITAFFKEGPEAYILLSAENVNAYVKICREVFSSVQGDVRTRLLRNLHAGTLHLNIYENMTAWPVTDGHSCGGGIGFATDKEIEELLSKFHVEEYRKGGVRPLKTHKIPLSDIRPAFERGEVARFDATKLLPARLFNVTLEQVSNMHGEASKKITVNEGIWHANIKNELCHHLLLKFADEYWHWSVTKPEVMQMAMRALIPWWLENICQRAPTLSEVANWSKNFRRVDFPYPSLYDQNNKTREMFRAALAERKTMTSSAINVRRLPKFDPGVNFPKRLGVAGLVEHVHNFIWFGTDPGAFHTDAYDNVLIQLTKTVEVIVFPADCGWLVCPKIGNVAGILRWAKEQSPDLRPPFHHFFMRSGQGVVLPSGAKHRIVVRSPQRIAINAFMEPKYGEMLWRTAPSNMYRRAGLDVLAARTLWVRSVKRLWETTGISMFWHTARMEVI